MRIVTAVLGAALLGVVVVGGAGCSASPAPVSVSANVPAAAGSSALLGEAERELGAARTTHYQHRTQVDEPEGTFDYDCSGFLDYALDRVLPADRAALPTSTSSRPLAADIERHLRAVAHGRSQDDPWRAVATVPELRGGDVIAWLATEDSTTGDTGHILIVTGTPTPDPDRPNLWQVPVVDSTLHPHARDSRRDGQTGLGTGTIGLDVDGSGVPVAFAWRAELSPRLTPTEIALGSPG